MKSIGCYSLSVVAALAGISCAGAGPRQVARPNGPLIFANSPGPTKEQEQVGLKTADAVNEFAFRLARETARRRPGAGFLVSPLSVATCHAMMLAGATGATRKELAAALALTTIKPEAVHDGMFALLYATTHTDRHELQVADAFFPVGSLAVDDAFKTTLRRRYDAETIPLEGVGPDAVAKVNRWVKERTAGMIPRVLDRLEPETACVLANAASFQGVWDKPFNRAKTRDSGFMLEPGRVVQVPTMHAGKMRAAWCGRHGWAAYEIPYESDAFAFIVLLPDFDNPPAAFLSRMTVPEWRSIFKDLEEDEIEVSMPKLSFDGAYDLVPIMKALGCPSLFHGSALGGIVSSRLELSISHDRHATHIEVDERGTRAAAATVGAPTADVPSKPKSMVIDRPFAYAIVHEPTGVIVFLGVCMDPRRTR